MIFVFGSNLGGIHGAGAARYAHQYRGAVMGVGIGRTGSSYAIPTKDASIRYSLPLREIQGYVNTFITYAYNNPDLDFKVTQIGCGLAGFTKEQIAPMFEDAPKNCFFDRAWSELLPNHNTWE